MVAPDLRQSIADVVVVVQKAEPEVVRVGRDKVYDNGILTLPLAVERRVNPVIGTHRGIRLWVGAKQADTVSAQLVGRDDVIKIGSTGTRVDYLVVHAGSACGGSALLILARV